MKRDNYNLCGYTKPPPDTSFRPRQRSGGIFPGSKYNQRKVKIATWEDTSTRFPCSLLSFWTEQRKVKRYHIFITLMRI